MQKICVLFTLAIVLLMSGCGKTSVKNEINTNTETTTAPTAVAATIQSTEALITEDAIYEANKRIDSFLNNFNNSNPSTPITTEMAQPYYHHGREHEEQIKFYMNDFEVVVSDIARLEVVISQKSMEKRTNDEYMEMFTKYAKGYAQNMNNETLENYWQQVLNNNIYDVKFDEFEVYLQKHDDNIELMKISGKIE